MIHKDEEADQVYHWATNRRLLSLAEVCARLSAVLVVCVVLPYILYIYACDAKGAGSIVFWGCVFVHP